MPRTLTPLSETRSPYFLGIDVGGTSVKLGLVDDDGRTLAYHTIPTEQEKGCEDGVRRIAAAVDEIARQGNLDKRDIARVGLATPGTMDIPAGMILEPPNMPGWRHFPLRDALSDACGLPVSFENDANAAAYGEFWLGSGRQYDSIIVLTLGTGIGGGIIINGRRLIGQHSHGAEVGHILLDYHDDAAPHETLGRGHFEAYASATAVVRRTREALRAGRESSLKGRVASGETLTPLLIAEEAEKDDRLALDIIDETARFLGFGITTLVHTIDPEAVILGGAMNFGGSDCELGQRFIGEIREEFRRRAFPTLAKHTVIEFAALGGDAGYLGAAGVARDEHPQAST